MAKRPNRSTNDILMTPSNLSGGWLWRQTVGSQALLNSLEYANHREKDSSAGGLRTGNRLAVGEGYQMRWKATDPFSLGQLYLA
jgi:hypothetical protein